MENRMSVSTTDLGPRPAARSGSILATLVGGIVAICSVIPYGFVALGLRLIMGLVFFISGQSMIAGPVLRFDWLPDDLRFAVVLPAEVKEATFRMFEAQFAALPMSPRHAAYIFSYAGFILPICLILGFATRLAALGLLVLTVLVSLYVMPEALFTLHIYWMAILTVLMTVGPGALSADALIRYLNDR
jgi:putative oxidoreductase